jgi:hypothetical protein
MRSARKQRSASAGLMPSTSRLRDTVLTTFSVSCDLRHLDRVTELVRG